MLLDFNGLYFPDVAFRNLWKKTKRDILRLKREGIIDAIMLNSICEKLVKELMEEGDPDETVDFGLHSAPGTPIITPERHREQAFHDGDEDCMEVK